MLNWLITWSLKNRFLVIVGALMFAGLGVVALRQLDIDAFPDTTPVQVQVNTTAPALSPEEVERQISFPVEQSLAGLPKLDNLQFHALWQQCRLAKENLLSNDEAAEAPLTILGRGSSLIGGTIKGKLVREDVEHLLVDGFFPVVKSDDMPNRTRRAGLVEVGLPYETDAAITRHLATIASGR